MITFISPKKAVNAAFYRLPVLQAEMERLKNNFEIYLKSGKADESEEFHKNLIKKFLTVIKPFVPKMIASCVSLPAGMSAAL